MAQFSGEAGFLQQAARAIPLSAFDHDPPGQETERAFDGAHMLVGDEMGHAFLRQQALDERDHDQIVRAHEFNQARTYAVGPKSKKLPRRGRPARPCFRRGGALLLARQALFMVKPS